MYNIEDILKIENAIIENDLDVTHANELLHYLDKNGWIMHRSGVSVLKLINYISSDQYIRIRDVSVKTITHGSKYNLDRDREVIILLSQIEYKSRNINNSKSGCPICGSSGDNLAFAFYCNNKSCSNYRK